MAITLTIGGEDWTGYLLTNSLSISDQLNSRNTSSFDLISVEGAGPIVTDAGDTLITSDGDTLYYGIRPEVGQEVIFLRDGVTRVFAGTIDDLTEEKMPGSDALRYTVACVDNNALADRRLVYDAYENQTLAAIVEDIVTEFLAGEGITTTYVQTGPVIERAVFNYVTAAQAFDDLAELTGFSWYIDYDKNLRFFSRETHAAPFALTDSSGNFRNLKVRRTMERYRNRQYIRGGVDLTVERTETFKGDGETRAFPLQFPIGKVPTALSINGGPQLTIGILGIDSGKDFYWNKGSNLLTQSDSGTKLTATDTGSVTYQGQFPLTVNAQDDAAIAAMASLTGGTGIIESIEDKPNLDTEPAATDFANAYLRKDGRIPTHIDFETDDDGLEAGQLITITIGAHNLTGAYLIDNVSADDIDGLFLRYKVRALDGESVGGWERFFKNMADQGRKFVIRENEVLTYMRRIAETVSVSDAVSYTTGAVESRADYALAGYSEAAS